MQKTLILALATLAALAGCGAANSAVGSASADQAPVQAAGLGVQVSATNNVASIQQPLGTFSSAGAADSNVVTHPQVKGALVRVPWSVVEPTPGTYDFSFIDNELNVLNNANKGWSLGVVAGPSAPSWLYDGPFNVAALNIIFRGQSVRTPKFWDGTLQTRLAGLAQALGRKYNDDSRLKLVYLPQMSANGIEGHFNGNTDSALISQGMTEDLWVSAVLDGARSFARAFPQKPVAVELHYILGSASAGTKIMQAITVDAELNNHVGVALWWLSGKTTYQPELLTAFETFPGTVYAQVIDRASNTASFANGDYASAFTQAKLLHIKYVEPWDVDFTSHRWDGLFQDFNEYSQR